ncbi:hypothetical protein EON79_06740 [bacterium]|nr:MAG: hypothetical protein EON79_06740 [bacterium]
MDDFASAFEGTLGPREHQESRARKLGLGYVDLDGIESTLAESMERWRLSETFLAEWPIVPLRIEASVLHVGVLDPLEEEAKRYLAYYFEVESVVDVLVEEDALRIHLAERVKVA